MSLRLLTVIVCDMYVCSHSVLLTHNEVAGLRPPILGFPRSLAVIGITSRIHLGSTDAPAG
jgi:hypothetical protein